MIVRWIAVGAVIGVVTLGLVRFVAAPGPQSTHYHANWRLIIDGEPLDLSADRYMEDVVACTVSDDMTPAQRVHMHNGEDDVVHVHHTGVAWGHLLTNLGFAAGPDYLILDDGRRFLGQDGRAVTYVKNGFVINDIGAEPIRPGDRLLISYGLESEAQVLAEQFPRVPDGAAAYDTMHDPAGCAGAAEVTFPERLRRAFWY